MRKLAVPIAPALLGLVLVILLVSTQHFSNCDQAQMGLAVDGIKTEPGPFYQPPKSNSFRKVAIAERPITDKVTSHSYEFIYEKYLGLRRTQQLKFLEIGLGCNMHYGPGASASVWRKYLPHAELWFAESDADCVALHKPRLDALAVNAVTGDQADVATLEGWVKETQGGFDVIVDDGGHQNQQILASFTVLFQRALKPGGVYVIEDMHVSRRGHWRGTGPIMLDVVRDCRRAY